MNHIVVYDMNATKCPATHAFLTELCIVEAESKLKFQAKQITKLRSAQVHKPLSQIILG